MAETVTAEQIEAFFKAIEHGNVAAARKTVEEHPDAVNWDYQGFSPLHWAITGTLKEGVKEFALYLIDKGADPNKLQPIAHGEPMIPFALGWNGEDIALKLVENGADLSWKSKPGSNAEIVKLAAEMPDMLWFLPGHGVTLLMSAAGSGALRLAAALLDRGADINEKDSNGQTALMYATQASKPDAAAFLISRGAEAVDYNNKGDSVMEMAEKGIKSCAVPAITEAFRQTSEAAAAVMRNGADKPITVSKGTIKLKKQEP